MHGKSHNSSSQIKITTHHVKLKFKDHIEFLSSAIVRVINQSPEV